MAVPTDSHIRVIAKAAMLRAAGSIVAPVCVPVIAAVALTTSGYSLTDYPDLIASGQLSPIKQVLMLMALLLWVVMFVPPAISTLSTGFVLGVADGQLITASGEKLGLDKIEAISVSRGLFHQMLRIRTGGEERTVNVTFAREGVADLRRRLQSDPHFRTISVD